MKPKNSVNEILEALTTSSIVTIGPGLVQEAMNIPGYRKLFAPVIPGLTDTKPAYAAYEQARQTEDPNTILLLVECQTIEEFREALGHLPLRTSSEWRTFSGN